MKKVIIYTVYAVGMHHHGNRQLIVGRGYYCKPEPGNPYDADAVAIYEDGLYARCSAYLKRSDARIIAELVRGNMVEGTILIKPKFEPVCKRGIGPVQRCNLGFYCKNENVLTVSEVLNKYMHAYKML